MRRKLQVFYAFFSAFIFAAALPNEFLHFGSPFFGLIALVPLYMALAHAKTFHFAGVLTATQITAVHVFSSYWLGYFKGFAIFTLGASAAAYFIWGYFIGKLLYGAFFISEKQKNRLLYKTGRNGFDAFRRIFLFAALWTLWEFSKSSGFLAYPWGTLLMSAFKMPLVTQIADITGSFGVTFLFALFAAVIGEGLLIYGSRRVSVFYVRFYAGTAALCIILFCLSGIYGAWQYAKPRIPIKKMQAVLVQPNTDSWESGSDSQPILICENLTEQALASGGIKPDVVVWSESMLSNPLPVMLEKYETSPKKNPLLPFIRKTGAPFIIGGPVVKQDGERYRYYNSALFFSPEGTLANTYAKMQLVPFAEIIPGADSVLVQKIMKTLVNFSDGWTQGEDFTVFTIPLQTGGSVTVSAPICYEDAFPAVCRALVKNGSEVFINITNDSWSRTKSAEYQHYVMASYRAIEFRTTLVRSTQSGYTTVTDPAGRILADLPLFTEASLFTEIPVYERTETPFYRFGQWLPACLFLSGLLLLISARREARATAL